LLGVRGGSNIIRIRWRARVQTCPCSAPTVKEKLTREGGRRLSRRLAGNGNKESSARKGVRQRRQRALGSWQAWVVVEVERVAGALESVVMCRTAQVREEEAERRRG
jgi:hypothetical protein